MSSSTQGITSDKMSANDRNVAFATIIGTTIEWYDFFIYVTVVGLSFLFRPLSAFLANDL